MKELTLVEAVEAHRAMWSYVREIYGEYPSEALRIVAKQAYAEDHYVEYYGLPAYDCYLCEYAIQAALREGKDPIGYGKCEYCPCKWGGEDESVSTKHVPCQIMKGVCWRFTSTTSIINIPVRPEIEEYERSRYGTENT